MKRKFLLITCSADEKKKLCTVQCSQSMCLTKPVSMLAHAESAGKLLNDLIITSPLVLDRVIIFSSWCSTYPALATLNVFLHPVKDLGITVLLICLTNDFF